MDEDQALDLLPEAYATALRLRECGSDVQAIAHALGIPPEAVGPLLKLADAKLEQLLATEGIART